MADPKPDPERYERIKTKLHIDELIQTLSYSPGRRVLSLEEIREGIDGDLTC